MTGFVLLALLLLIVFWAVGAHSRLVSLRSRIKEALAQFGAQLQRRHELILVLAGTVKDNMQSGQEAADAVAAACDRAVTNISKTTSDPADADAMQRLAAAEGILSSSLNKLFSLSEAHPAVHANQDMMRLTEELAGTENKIAFARQVYNDGASQYNASIEQMPGAVAARMFGFKKAALLPAILSL